VALRAFRAGLRTLLRRRDVDREIDDEIAHYIEEATRENVRLGMSPADAERAARARVGSVTSAREQALSSRWEAGIEPTLGDVAYGFRTLLRNRGFTVAAILTLALGIGANTAMFSVVNAVMLRPLPWRDAGDLALIWTDDVVRGPRESTAYATIADWRSSSRTFNDIAYYSTQRVALMPADPAAGRGRSRSGFASANMFSVLGVRPAIGRTFSAAEEGEKAAVAVISHSLWHSWFGGAPDVIGRTLSLDDGSRDGLASLTVIGVMPPGFYFPDRLTEIWTPATTYWRFDRESTERFPSSARRWTAIGRLAPGSSIGDAQADLARIGRYLASVHVSNVPDFPGFGTTVLPVLDSITGQNVQATLWILLGAVSLVLLVACVNVANLFLARGAARQQEFAVRRALGAARGRLVRQMLTESALLSLTGAAIGVVAAWWGTNSLAVAASGFVPRIDEIALDWRVLLFALAASIVAGLTFGLAPALRFSRADATATLREGMRNTGHHRLGRSRSLLVVTEFALALTLLTGAGLLIRSLVHLQSVNPGFDPSQVLTVRIEFPTIVAPPTPANLTQSEAERSMALGRVAVASQLAERVGALPGVTAVGYSDDLFVNRLGNASIFIPGRTDQEMATGELREGSVTAGFFAVLRVPLRSGRFISDQDATQKIRAQWSLAPTNLSLEAKRQISIPEPVVVNEAFVQRFFPDEDPLGKWFCIDPANKAYWYEIVGVAGDMHRSGLERHPVPEYFGPLLPSSNGRVDLLVRTTGDPLGHASTVHREVLGAIAGATVVSVSTADVQLGGFSALRRLQTSLLALFALLALALAAIGIFGVVHYTVSERTREIGVRMALGATPGSVMRLILGQGMRTAAIGIVIGVAASLAWTRLLSSQLFGIESNDPVTFSAVSLLLALVGVGACWLAGRRALRVDPVRALREG
jgi:predicted permease